MSTDIVTNEMINDILDRIATENGMPVMEPEDNTVREPLPAPLEVLHPRLQQVVLEASESCSAPQQIAMTAVMELAACLIGGGATIEGKHDFCQPANMWTLIVAESGVGKSPVISKIFKSLHRLDVEQHELYKMAMEGYKLEMVDYNTKIAIRKSNVKAKIKSGDKEEAPQQSLYEEIGDEPKKPIRRHIFVDDTTQEALADALEGSPTGILFYHDEMNGFMSDLDRYSSGGSGYKSRLCSAYDGGVWKTTRVGDRRSVTLPHAHMSIFGGIQPKLLSSLFSKGTDSDLGWLPRWNIIRAANTKITQWTEAVFSQEAEQTVEALTFGIFDIINRQKIDTGGLLPDDDPFFEPNPVWTDQNLDGSNRTDKIPAILYGSRSKTDWTLRTDKTGASVRTFPDASISVPLNTNNNNNNNNNNINILWKCPSDFNPLKFLLDKGAKALYIQWFNRKKVEGEAEGTKGIITKLVGKCLRFCLVIHLMDSVMNHSSVTTLINEDCMRRAIIYSEYVHRNYMDCIALLNNAKEESTPTPLTKYLKEVILEHEEDLVRDSWWESSDVWCEWMEKKMGVELSKKGFSYVAHSVGLSSQKDREGKKRGWAIFQKTFLDIKNERDRQIYLSETSELSNPLGDNDFKAKTSAETICPDFIRPEINPVGQISKVNGLDVGEVAAVSDFNDLQLTHDIEELFN
jgi:hypothetical protein